MDIHDEILKLIADNNISLEQIAEITQIPAKKLQKSFDKHDLQFKDAKKIIDIFGYEFIFEKII